MDQEVEVEPETCFALAYGQPVRSKTNALDMVILTVRPEGRDYFDETSTRFKQKINADRRCEDGLVTRGISTSGDPAKTLLLHASRCVKERCHRFVINISTLCRAYSRCEGIEMGNRRPNSPCAGRELCRVYIRREFSALSSLLQPASQGPFVEPARSRQSHLLYAGLSKQVSVHDPPVRLSRLAPRCLNSLGNVSKPAR
jgi:hypothetical protein